MTSSPASPGATVLVVSCSLNPTSRSHRLALAAAAALEELRVGTELVDLRDWALPLCDGSESYHHPSVKPLAEKVTGAAAVLLATPIYNYDVSAATKNLVELTGSAWADKPVGFLCSAGGRGSYMAPVGLANSLMFDFRSHIIPHFVYVTDRDFTTNGELSGDTRERIRQLAHAAVGLARALASVKGRS